MKRLAVLIGIALVGGACGHPSSETDQKAPIQPISQPQASAESAERYRNVEGEAAFVGDAACASCHEELYQSYQTHGMAQSYYPLTADRAVEDFSNVTLHHAASGLSYRVYREGDRFFQEEFRQDASGAVVHRLAREMEYVVGSGSAARTYLTEEGGRLYELPLTWYTQEGRWDFSPGYEVANGRFDRLIPDRCMACHNSYPESVPFVEGKYQEVPHGIGCERCHGPGSLHVEARLSDPEAPGEVDVTIVNPADLTLDRRLDVCQQCHLHTAVSVLREGQDAFGFRPSQDLAGHVALFALEEEADGDAIGVISHADRMKQSACFLESLDGAAPMDCVTCHNPHEGFRDAGPAYFNQTCFECHAPAPLEARLGPGHSAEANCIQCHMPKVEAEDAPHASFTDHKIRVVEEGAARSTDAPTEQRLVPYFGRDAGSAEGRLYEGIAYVVYGRQQGSVEALDKGIALLGAALEEAPDHGEAQFLLGWARMQRGDVEVAIPALEEAVRLGAGVPERLNALAEAYERVGRGAGAITRLYERALTIQPDLADVRVNYGRYLETQGRLEAALAQYRRAAEEQPWLEKAHYNIGTVLLRQGNLEEAEAALQQAITLQPGYVEALGNLGLLYASQGRMKEAFARFERAAEVGPEHPVALGNLGVYYLNESDFERAEELLRRAVEADPTYVDGLVNLAVVYVNTGADAQARDYAQRALEVDPGNARAQQVLAAL